MAEESSNNDPNKKKGRKKRKNFLSNAKKYAKKGQLGRGTKMSEELYQYFVGILDAMKKGIEDEDERQALVNNVLERTKEDELNIAGNQLGCRVIELLLPFASAEDLERFMEVLYPELRKLCADNFTSHVVETLLRVSCDRATEHMQNEDSEMQEEEVPKKKRKKEKQPKSKYSEEHIKNCHDFTIKICKYALNNLEDFVWDSYANHILRSALKCLSGIILLPGEKPKINLFVIPSKVTKGIPPHEKLNYKPVPQEFKDLVSEFANRLASWPQFKDLPYKNITSGLLQVLLFAIKNVDKSLTRTLITRLLNESFAPDDWVANEGGDEEKEDKKADEDNKDEANENGYVPKSQLPPVFSSEPAVRLLEAALFVSKKKTYTQLYAKCFINRLPQLAAMPSLNYTVQRLLDNCSVKEEFEPMFEELSSRYSAILASGNTGVLVALAKACQRLKAKQAQLLTNLETALECSEPAQSKYLPVAILRLLPMSRIDTKTLDKEYFVHVHGSVILQSVLDFQRPAKVVGGLLELSSDELVVILSDAKGCHVADAFFKGQFVGVKSRDKMVWKLKGYYQQLALSQYGSRAFEQVYAACTVEQKLKIMAELADKANLLNGTQYGRLIAAKLNVELFKKSPDSWKCALEKVGNK